MKKGFTLMELLVVIGIIAILALAIIPNFIGFDAEARIATSKSNLSTLRNRIVLFRAKEGRYPDSLGELLEKSYYDAGIEKRYLKKLPQELMTDKKGNNSYVDQPSHLPLNGEGGWVYLTDKADIVINISEPLDKGWGQYKDQKPNEW